MASVEVEKNKVLVSSKQEAVGVFDASGPTANVGFSAAYTRNLGNYESLKVTVSLFMPVLVSLDPAVSNKDAINETFDKVQRWVDKKVESVLEEVSE